METVAVNVETCMSGVVGLSNTWHHWYNRGTREHRDLGEWYIPMSVALRRLNTNFLWSSTYPEPSWVGLCLWTKFNSISRTIKIRPSALTIIYPEFDTETVFRSDGGFSYVIVGWNTLQALSFPFHISQLLFSVSDVVLHVWGDYLTVRGHQSGPVVSNRGDGWGG